MPGNTATGREHDPTTHVAEALTISATNTANAPVRVDREQHRDINNGTVSPINRTVGHKDKIPLTRWRVWHEHLEQEELET